MVVLVVLGAAAGDTLARASVVGHKPGRLAPASRVVLGSSFEPVRGIYGVLESGEYLLLSTTVPRGRDGLREHGVDRRQQPARDA